MLGYDNEKGGCDRIGPSKISKVLSGCKEKDRNVSNELKIYASEKMNLDANIVQVYLDSFMFEKANK